MANCSNCGAELARGETEMCYVCSKATPQEQANRLMRFLGKTERPIQQPRINVLNTLPATPERKLKLDLSSAKQITIDKILLYPEPEIRQFLSLKAKAQEELGGFSTGIGFWGSPEWAIGGAAALGLVESLVSNAKAKQGMKTLTEASLAQLTMKTHGVFFDIHSISAIWQPNPAAWRAEKDSDDPDMGKISHIHDGDEFIWIEVGGHPIAIRWSTVECCHLV